MSDPVNELQTSSASKDVKKEEGSIIKEEEETSEENQQSGPRLDGNNQHKDVQDKGKPLRDMQQNTKSRTGKLVNRFHWLLAVDDFNVSSTRDSDSIHGW